MSKRKPILELMQEAQDRVKLAGDLSYAVFCNQKTFDLLRKELTVVYGAVIKVTNFMIDGLIIEVNKYVEDGMLLVVNREIWKLVMHRREMRC